MKKKFLPFIATTVITAAALLPLGMQKVEAISYEPTYTCYYRDIAGSCLNYQTSNPYHQTQASYGNRQTYPFNTMFNARTTTQSPWDNRYSNNDRYNNFRYEGGHDSRDGQWLNYYDEDDNVVRPYKFQSNDYYQDNNNFWFNKNDGAYIELEYTKSYCTGKDCRFYNRY